jgi:monoamine oxidase
VRVVTEDGTEIRAERAVVAVPPPVLSAMGFSPPLAPSRLAALHALPVASGGKVIGRYREGDRVRAALSGRVVTSGPLHTAWVSDPVDANGPAMVTGVITGAGRPTLGSPQNALALLDHVVEQVVGANVTRTGGAVKDWTADRYAVGWGFRAGAARQDALVAQLGAPEGDVHFALEMLFEFRAWEASGAYSTVSMNA